MGRVVVWNKMDALSCKEPVEGGLRASALCGWGLNDVRARVLQGLLPQQDGAEEVVVVNSRQAAHLAGALDCLQRALDLAASQCEDLLAAEVRRANVELGLLIGEGASPALLDSIFSQFCIGK